MKIKTILLAIATTTALSAANSSIGIVDFRRCINESERGKAEQAQLETLKTQLSSKLEETESQLRDIASKGRDPDYLDSLSPEAEEQLRVRFQTLSQEYQQQQQQFYQIIQQQEGNVLVELNNLVGKCAFAVAGNHGLDLVVREDTAFYFQKSMDVTDEVIAKMDEIYGKEKQ
ncbi:MAG: OmpH family outer membrane protein [Verrucomicrobia bacterium]|nr:OmpH family outer membrane protein [Verrucomicrobiota bacterium]